MRQHASDVHRHDSSSSAGGGVAGKRTVTGSMSPRPGTASAPSAAAAAASAGPSVMAVQALASIDEVFSLHLSADEHKAAKAGDPHEVAATGMSGAPTSLPHLDLVQRSFGAHDLSQVPAFLGGAAADAANDLGAQAYAYGGGVAFREAPDLHTAAHEAAHVVQQRGGVQLAGGVGAAGDPYEQHADRVADLVVSGQSAEAALDEMSGASGGSATAPVQRVEDPAAEPGECEPAPAKTGVEMVLGDLAAGFTQGLARQLDLVLPQPGTEVEIAASLRCPVLPPVHLSGKLSITASRDDEGVTASVSGGLGPSIGADGVFGDLLGTGSIEGKGKTATDAAQMLVLAIEALVRSVPDVMYVALLSPLGFSNPATSAPMAALLLAAAAGPGDLVGNGLADMTWGRGHLLDAVTAMEDGESAGVTVGLSAEGDLQPPTEAGGIEAGAEANVGVAEKFEFEKEAGKAVTSTAQSVFTAGVSITVGPITGEVEVEAALTGDKAGTATLAGSGLFDTSKAGAINEYAQFVIDAIRQIRPYLQGKAAEGGDPQGYLAELDDLLGAKSGELSGALSAGAQGQVVAALAQLGLVKRGVEVAAELDLADKKATLSLSVLTEASGEVPVAPGVGGKIEMTQKQQVFETEL